METRKVFKGYRIEAIPGNRAVNLWTDSTFTPDKLKARIEKIRANNPNVRIKVFKFYEVYEEINL